MRGMSTCPFTGFRWQCWNLILTCGFFNSIVNACILDSSFNVGVSRLEKGKFITIVQHCINGMNCYRSTANTKATWTIYHFTFFTASTGTTPLYFRNCYVVCIKTIKHQSHITFKYFLFMFFCSGLYCKRLYSSWSPQSR